MADTSTFRYDVCLSFAGEDRDYVEAVANNLRQRGMHVFYDRYERVELWGKDLYAHLDDVYRHAAGFCVLFASSHYAEKIWPTHERRSAQARALEENTEYILPVRLDDTEIPGLPPTVGYIKGQENSPEDLAALIIEKVGLGPRVEYLPPSPDILLEKLGIEEEEEKDLVVAEAEKFLETLRRMSEEERRLVVHLFRSGCPAELPENVHINLDLLRRITGFPSSKIRRLLGAIRSLGFYPSIREEEEEGHHFEPGEIVVLEWHDMSVEGRGNATITANEMITAIIEHYCEEHAAEALERLDFSCLSSATAVEDVHPRESSGDAKPSA